MNQPSTELLKTLARALHQVTQTRGLQRLPDSLVSQAKVAVDQAADRQGLMGGIARAMAVTSAQMDDSEESWERLNILAAQIADILRAGERAEADETKASRQTATSKLLGTTRAPVTATSSAQETVSARNLLLSRMLH